MAFLRTLISALLFTGAAAYSAADRADADAWVAEKGFPPLAAYNMMRVPASNAPP